MKYKKEEYIVEQEAINQYLKIISRNLCCTEKKKKEIVKELESDIRIAMENGETWEEVRERMGTPEEIAEEFNENFSEKELQVNKQKKYFYLAGILVVVVCIAIVAIILISNMEPNSGDGDGKKVGSETVSTSKPEEEENDTTPTTQTVTSHSNYDESAITEQTKRIISLLDADDYDTLRNEYTAEVLQSMMEESKIGMAKQAIGTDWGALVSYGDFYMDGIEQAEKQYVVVQVNVSYEKENVAYTITFDEEMKLVGIYMK